MDKIIGWKDSLKEVSKDTKGFVNEFKNIGSDNINIDELIKKFSGVDKSVVKVAEKVKAGKASITDLDEAMQKTSSSTAKFSATLKSVAANIGIMLAINLTIKGLSKAWDTLNVTVEEQEQKIDELKSSYESLQSEYDTLSQKQDTTDAEKRRLEYLERRLELDERILKAEQAQLFDEKTGNKFTDYFDEDNLNTQYAGEMNFRNNHDGYAYLEKYYNKQLDSIKSAKEQIAYYKELQSGFEKGSLEFQSYQSSIDAVQEKETKALENLSGKESQLTVNLGKYADNIEYLQEQLNSGELTSSQEAIAREQLQTWQELYDYTELIITSIQKLNGTYEETLSVLDQVNEKYAGGYSDGAAARVNRSDEQQAFWDWSKDLNDEQLELVNSDAFEKAIEKQKQGLNGASLSAENYASALKELESKEKDAFSFSPSAFSESISALSSLQDTYNAFYENAKDNKDFTFNISDIENLRETFGNTCTEFENFEKLATSSSTSADELQQSFNKLAAEFIFGTNMLDGLNIESREQILTQLKLQGILGAGSLITEEFAQAYADAEQAGLDFANATLAQISGFIQEGQYADETTQKIYAYAIQKKLANENCLNTYGDIMSLEALCKNLGIATESLMWFTRAKNLQEQVDNGDSSELIVNQLNIAKNKCKELASQVSAASSNYTNMGQSASNAAKSASRGAKETTETFDWIDRSIQSIEDDISKLDHVVSSTFSTTEAKNKALADQIGLINKEIALQQQAYESYMQKAESVGLSDDYKNLVRNGSVNIEDITDSDLKEAIKNYQAYYDKAKETQDKIDELHEKAKQKHVDGYELEVKELETLHENQSISEREYLDQMLLLYKKYYDNQAEFAVQAKGAKLALLNDEKSYLETVASAASSLLDDKINDLEDKKDKAREEYEKQIEDIETVIAERKKEIDVIQAQIDTIEDANDELDRQKALEQALYDLRRAQTQKNRVYKEGQGVIYTQDSHAVSEASDAVDDAQKEIVIANLQKEIDSIQDGIDALEMQKSKLEELADESDAYFDEKIGKLQDYQNEWQKALEFEEQAAAITNLKSMFGEDAVEQILSGNMTLLSTWKQNYADTLAELDLVSQGFVGSITEEWAKLSGVSVNMEDANEQFHNTGNAAQDAQTQINGVVEKLQNLSNEVSAYQLPTLNAAQLTASLGAADGTSGILGQLNTFVQRFHEICDSIPLIWQGAMASISGQSETGVSGESVSCDPLFQPLLNAMDAAKNEIDLKLQEYTDLWKKFNTDLTKIIGIDNGGGAQEASGNAAFAKSPLQPNASSGGKGQPASSGTDTIVGSIQSGGQMISDTFNNEWIPSFTSMGKNVNDICAKIVSCVNEMAAETVNACRAAIDAINKANAAKKSASSKNDKPTKFEGTAYVGRAFAKGTDISVRRDQTALLNELGEEGIIRDGEFHKVIGGAQFVDVKKGDIILNHRQVDELDKYGKITSGNKHGRLIGSFADGTAKAIAYEDLIPVSKKDMHPWNQKNFNKIFDAFRSLPAPQFDVPTINYENIVSANRSTPIHINIGDIKLEGVQDQDSLARSIVAKFPNRLLQELYKK